MKKYTLEAAARTLTGRKVKQLRQKKILPGNVYGKKIKSIAVQVPFDTFSKVAKEAGSTGIVELKVGNEVRPVLIHNVQIHPVTSLPLHVDFFQVDLKEKIKASVPVEIIGIPEAVTQKLGVLLILTTEIEVEALPAELPEKIEVDVTKLAQVGDSVKVADITLHSGVVAVTSGEAEVVKIGSLVTKEAEKLAAEEAAAKATAAAESQAAATPAATGTGETAAPSTETKAKAPVEAAKPAPEAKKAEK